MPTLPAHARVIGRDTVWIEGDALSQLARVASLPGCACAVGQPDLHPGPTMPIGAVFAFDAVLPMLVGADAGCGVRLSVLHRVKHRGDALERRVREATEGPALPAVDPDVAFRAVWSSGPHGLAGLAGVPHSLAELAAQEPAFTGPNVSAPEGDWGRALGTIGGGNHFVEASKVSGVDDRRAAALVGLRGGGHAVLAHSGSRGLGRCLARRWGSGRLGGEQAHRYLAELAGAVRFAQANRLILSWRMLRAFGAASRVVGALDLVHNTVVPAVYEGQPVWVHRKGCAPAEMDQLTVVLGSRGTPSWVMRGLGAQEALWSVAHGAGRRIARNEARGKIRIRYRRASLSRTALGSRVICDDPSLLYEEHPDCYKDIESVVGALASAGAAERVAELTPLITVKR
jgi:release factor H-coupled RctB family protein